MSNKTKTFTAVFAVVMMVCVALMPICLGQSSAENANEKDGTGATLSVNDIFGMLSDLGTGKTLVANGIMLVPTDEEIVGAKIDIGPSITETKTINAGDYVEIANQSYVFGNGTAAQNGKIVVKEGASVVFWKLGETGTFSVQNKNVRSNALIVAESGAMISILGINFKVYCGGNDSERFGIPIISVTGSNKAINTFKSVYASDKMSLGVSVSGEFGYTKLTIFNMLDCFQGSNLQLDGKIVKSGNTITLSEARFNLHVVDGRYSYDFVSTDGKDSTVSVTMQFQETEVSDASKVYAVKLSVNADLKLDFTSYFINDATRIFTNAGILINKLDVNIKNTVTDTGATKREVTTEFDASFGTGGKIVLTAGDITLNKTVGNIPVQLMFNTVSVTLTALDIGFKTHTTGTGPDAKEIDTFSSSFDLDAKALWFKTNVSIILWTVELSEVDNLETRISDITTVYNASEKVFATTIGAFVIDGEILAGYIINSDTLDLEVTVSRLILTAKIGETTCNIAFDASIDVSINYDNIDRHMITTIGEFSGVLGKIGTTQSYKIASFGIKNDIPFSKIIMLDYVEQNLIGFVNATGLEIISSDAALVIKGNTFEVECNTIVDGIADVIGVSMNSKYEITVAQDSDDATTSMEIKSAVISGFLQNLGANKESFTIEAKSVSVPTVRISDMLRPYFVWKVELDSCKATFGGGLLPAELVVKNNVTFAANGLSAFDFKFEGTDISGTIGINLADRLIYKTREITIGSETLKVVAENDFGEYALALNLATKNGTLTAREGMTITSNPSLWTKTDNTHATFVFGDKEFGDVTIATKYYFSYDGENPVSKDFGAKITLDKALPAMTGKQAVGWSDGTKTYAVGSVYTMPAKNVDLIPVYADIVEPTPVAENTVAVESQSETVAVEVDKLQPSDNLVVEIKGAAVYIDQNTIANLGLEQGDVLVISAALTAVTDDVKSKVVGDNPVYNVELQVNGTPVSEYSGTSFTVRVNINVEGDITDFKVSYMDENGHLTSVGVDSFKKCDDGTYDVVFTTNHFSDFVIEPVFAAEKEQIGVIFTIMIAVILAAIAIVAVYGRPLKSKKE